MNEVTELFSSTDSFTLPADGFGEPVCTFIAGSLVDPLPTKLPLFA